MFGLVILVLYKVIYYKEILFNLDFLCIQETLEKFSVYIYRQSNHNILCSERPWRLSNFSLLFQCLQMDHF